MKPSLSRTPAFPACLSRSFLDRVIGAFALLTASLAPQITETAIANGDTRTIYLHHAHTGEDIAATYLVNGQYDSRVLQQLNWFLRDWRRDEPTNMDPRLFDVVWEAYRHAGVGDQFINVVSAYRSPETNAMLRARSRAVAKYSQHMLGKAMDTTMPGLPMSHIREIGMRMQRGGVGYYPTAGTPFVHLDVGNVRSWPRMSYDQLVRLFPDGKTVHLPTNGQPLARYEEAKAEIEARANGAYVTAPRRTVGGLFAMLFGGGEEEPEEVAAPAPSTRKQWGLQPRNGRVQTASDDGEEGAAAPAPEKGRRGRQQYANLPRGETAMSAPGAAPAEATQLDPQAAQQAQAAALMAAQQPEEAAPPKRKYVRAPLPPSRPEIAVARAEAPLEAAPQAETRPESFSAAKPQPLDGGESLERASNDRGANDRIATTEAPDLLRGSDDPPLAGASRARKDRANARIDAHVDGQVSAPASRETMRAAGPLPPRRPAMLAASKTPAPASGKSDVKTDAKADSKPDATRAIATVVKDKDRTADEALAYAPSGKTSVKRTEAAAPLPPKRAALAPVEPLLAHAPAATAVPTRGATVIGSAVTGLRAAARASNSTSSVAGEKPAQK